MLYWENSTNSSLKRDNKLVPWKKMNNQVKDRFGLSEREINTIQNILKKFPDVETVYIFGSRAKGSFKEGSDIDLAITNKGVDTISIARIKGEFEESSLPYKVDIVAYPDINHKELKDHIDRVGILIYEISRNDLMDR